MSNWDLKKRGEKKIDDVTLLEEFESGKTYEEIANEYGYGKGGAQILAKRLNKLKNYQGRQSVKLNKIGNSRTLCIPNKLIKLAGFDPEKELRAKRTAKDGKIVLELEVDE